jgi:hypothetical protein
LLVKIIPNGVVIFILGPRQSVHSIHPTSYEFVVMVGASWRSNKTVIKFMISYFKGKIYAHKVAGMTLDSKLEHFINAFGMMLSVGCILCTAGRHRIQPTSYAFVVMVGVQIIPPLNL